MHDRLRRAPNRSTQEITEHCANASANLHSRLMSSPRVVVVPVDDSQDSERSFDWLVANFLKDSDEVPIAPSMICMLTRP